MLKQPERRIIRADVGDKTIHNIYAPAGGAKNSEKGQIFFRETFPANIRSVKYPVVIVGDFNAVEDTVDKTRKTKVSTLVNKALVGNYRSASYYHIN